MRNGIRTVGATRPRRQRKILIAVAALAMALGLAVPAGASAATADTSVKSLTVTSSDAVGHATLTLSFTNGISAAEAVKVRSEFAGSLHPRPAYGTAMWCWGSLGISDSNGYFTIQYNCGSPRTLPWGYKISSAVQAIIVSPVSEDGLLWWRNGYYAGKNAAHVVPANYQFHGTMNPVWATDNVSYQDYMTFRHSLGGGGTGSITFAGGVDLQN